MANEVYTVLNRDIAVMHIKLLRAEREVVLSQSKGTTTLKSADRDRLVSYIDDARRFLNYSYKAPETDEPEAHPRKIELRALPTIGEMDNTNLLNAIYLLHDCMVENANCASARHGSGYIIFDYDRLGKLFDKLTSLIIDYIDKAPLLDMPETSPDAPGVVQGSTGIQPGNA